MKRQAYRVSEVFTVPSEEWIPEGAPIQYTRTTDTPDGPVTDVVTVVSAEAITQFLWNHLEWSFLSLHKKYNPARVMFWTQWDYWKRSHAYDIDRMAMAYFKEYDPLSNYDRNDNITVTREYDNMKVTDHISDVQDQKGGYEDIFVTGAENITDTPADFKRIYTNSNEAGQKSKITSDGFENSTATEPSEGTKVADTNSVATYESDNVEEKPVDKTTHEGTTVDRSLEEVYYNHEGYTRTTQARRDTDTISARTDTIKHIGDDTHTTTGGYSDTTTGTTRGNIGVTTSQQMLEAEIEARRNNLCDRLLQWFASECLVLLPEVNEDDY